MDNNILNKYKEEMLRMYRSVAAAAPTAEAAVRPEPPAEPESQPQDTNAGYLLGIVTAIRGLYPVKDAKVTVFTGEYQNPTVIDTDLTDESGRTKLFSLPTPEKALSLDQSNTVLPYANYNMIVEADGYIKNIHLNIPIFGTVTSLQQTNLLPEETAGTDKGPQIFDEAQKYEL